MAQQISMTAEDLYRYIDNQFDYANNRCVIADIICTTRFQLAMSETTRFTFNNCWFEQEVEIFASIENMQYYFNRCVFNHVIETSNTGNNPTYKFSNSQINGGMNINDAKNVTLFVGSSEGSGQFDFDYTHFQFCSLAGLTMKGSTDDSSVSFVACIFEASNFMNTTLINPCFNRSIFKSGTSFDGAKLVQKYDPRKGHFFNVVFEQHAFFNGTDFTDHVAFSGAQFHGLTIFLGCNGFHLDCVADFAQCTFHGAVHFDGSAFKNLIVNNVSFLKLASFNRVKALHFELTKTVFVQSAVFIDAHIKDGPRETFRVIKNELLKNNHSVEAIDYRAKELYKLEKSLNYWKNPREKIVLCLTGMSNSYGTNWLKGLLFTIASAILFYLWYLPTLAKFPVQLGWVSWKEFRVAANMTGIYFMKFFIVTHDPDFMLQYEPTVLSYMIDALARVFISYGIVQTVQAFRKYVK